MIFKGSKKTKLALILFLCVFSLILFIALIIGGIFVYNRHFASANEVIHSTSTRLPHEYNFLEHDFETNEVTVGFVTIFNDLKDDEFLSYIEEDGNHVLISKLGTKEYRCSGSCVCYENSGRKSSLAQTLKSGMIYLVAAISSHIAYNIAKDHFENECKKSFSDGECEESSIESKVDDCEGYEENDDIFEEDLEIGDEMLLPEDFELLDEMDEMDNPKGKRRYLCHGHCWPYTFKHEKARQLAEKLNCILIQWDGEVVIDPEENAGYDGHQRMFASLTFQKEQLHPYCHENTEASYVYQGKNLIKTIHVSLCQGYGRHDDFYNPTILCRQIYD